MFATWCISFSIYCSTLFRVFCAACIFGLIIRSPFLSLFGKSVRYRLRFYNFLFGVHLHLSFNQKEKFRNWQQNYVTCNCLHEQLTFHNFICIKDNVTVLKSRLFCDGLSLSKWDKRSVTPIGQLYVVLCLHRAARLCHCHNTEAYYDSAITWVQCTLYV